MKYRADKMQSRRVKLLCVNQLKHYRVHRQIRNKASTLARDKYQTYIKQAVLK